MPEIGTSETYSSDNVLEGSFQVISKGISSVAISEGVPSRLNAKVFGNMVSLQRRNYRKRYVEGLRFNDRCFTRQSGPIKENYRVENFLKVSYSGWTGEFILRADLSEPAER